MYTLYSSFSLHMYQLQFTYTTISSIPTHNNSIRMCSTFLVNEHHVIEAYIGHDDKAVHSLGPNTRCG
jgi:hypothetical protein